MTGSGQQLPQAASPSHVAVIGAGLVGLSSALWLQKAGHQVTLIDRHDPLTLDEWKTAASFGNACTFAPAAVLPVATPGILGQVPRMLANPDGPLALRWPDLPALAPWLWQFLRSSTAARVEEITRILAGLMRAAAPAQQALLNETGSENLTSRTGLLYMYRLEAAFEAARRLNDLRARNGVVMRVLSKDEVRAREPNLAPIYHCAVTFDESWHFNTPYLYARALFETYRARGGVFLRAEAKTLRAQPGGIRVEAGAASASYDQVVIACGAWSKPLGRSIGDKVLLDTERGYHVLFPEAVGKLNGPVCYGDSGFYMTPTAEGLRCAGTVELGGLDKPARSNRLEVIKRVAPKQVTEIGPPGREWMGFRPSMPDSLPVIGKSPKDARVIHAYGHGHIGLTLSAITGKLVAELASGLPTSVDLSPLRPDRF